MQDAVPDRVIFEKQGARSTDKFARDVTTLPGRRGIGELNDALVAHCQQSARIVRDFYGDWYSATEFREGITPQNTSRFVAVALNKIRAEMVSQKGNQ